MLHALLIAANDKEAELLARVIRQTGTITIEQTYCPAPAHYQLTRTLNTLNLDVIFVDAAAPRAFQIREEILRQAGRAAVVDFSFDPCCLPAGGHSLSLPLTPGGVADTVRQAVRDAVGRPVPNLVGFVPAKGGAGATTVAMNAACRMAASFGKRVLLAEADLGSGALSDWLHANPLQSINQTLEVADSCASLMWPRHVASKFGVDWMLAARQFGFSRHSWSDYYHLLAFAAARYDHVVVDFPTHLDSATLAAAELCGTIHVVATPEFLSLRLARQRVCELIHHGIDASRIRLTVNRSDTFALKPEDMAREAGCAVGAAFPNDYPAVHRAILEAGYVDENTRLGKAFRAFAGSLCGNAQAPKKEAGWARLSWLALRKASV